MTYELFIIWEMGMFKKGIGALLCVFCCTTVVSANDSSFVDNADEMVEQMLKGDKKYGKTRSFSVAAEAPATRSITVHAKNKQGQEETVVVQVPASGVDPAARIKIEFDANSANLRSSAYPLLEELSSALRDDRVAEHKVCIKGHTDSDGDSDSNRGLSYNRANTVLKYLQGTGQISSDNLQVFGYGEEMPMVQNDTSYNKQINRRVEVSLNCPEVQ